MASFIRRQIEKYTNKSLEEGQELYRKYFIYTNLYLDHKEKVDSLLIEDGYESSIVTE